MDTAETPTIDRSKPGWWKEYYQRNKEKVKARNEAWLKANKDKMLPKLRAKWKRAAARNGHKKSAKRREERRVNPERLRRWNRDSQKRCWAKRQAYARAYYQKNKEALKRASMKHYLNNKEQHFEYARKRRALQMKATVNLTAIKEFIRRVKSKPTVVCYYCESIVPTNAMHFDHIIPLIKGGSHSVDNLCASCPKCNLTKNASTIKAWFKMGQQILNL